MSDPDSTEFWISGPFIFRDGIFRDGIFRDGIFRDGIFRDGCTNPGGHDLLNGRALNRIMLIRVTAGVIERALCDDLV